MVLQRIKNLIARIKNIEAKVEKLVDRFDSHQMSLVDNAYIALLPVHYRESQFKAEYEDLLQTVLYDAPRLLSFTLNLSRIVQYDVPGAFAELGVWEGHTAKILHYFSCKNHRPLYLFDTFEGLDKRDLVGVDAHLPEGNFPTSIEAVKAYLGDNLDNTTFLVGYFPDTITEKCKQERFSFVHIDCDLYKPIKEALHFFWPRMNYGGVVFIHDYHNQQFSGAQKAVEEFCAEIGSAPVLLPDIATTSVIIKNKE